MARRRISFPSEMAGLFHGGKIVEMDSNPYESPQTPPITKKSSPDQGGWIPLGIVTFGMGIVFCYCGFESFTQQEVWRSIGQAAIGLGMLIGGAALFWLEWASRSPPAP